jgi:hypothetical protein
MQLTSRFRVVMASAGVALALTLPPVPSTHTSTRLQSRAIILSRGFEQNAGQSDPKVRFLLRGSGYGIFITPGEVVLTLAPDHSIRSTLRLNFPGANPTAEVSGLEPFPGRVHYVTGRDASKWRANITTFHKVRYHGLYAGIDLILYQGESSLEYDFQVAPYADASRVRLSLRGAHRLAIDSSGDLVVSLSDSEIRMRRPEIYQRLDGEKGQKRLVRARYVLEGDDHVGFQIGSYDRSRPLVIDPVLSYSSYLGGSGNDNAVAVAVDAAGNSYLTGDTVSPDFPLSEPAQSQPAGQKDVFVTKVNAAGTAWLYSTYLGGGGNDSGRAIAVDSSGNAYVAGLTGSLDFPVVNPYQAALAGLQNAFVAKLNQTGSGLIYSTYLGGSSIDQANGIAVDSSGAVFVAGDTVSSNFPTRNPLQASLAGGKDGFVTKIDPSGASLAYSTFLGGSANDTARAIALDASGNANVVGETASSNFPILNAIKVLLTGLSDAFVSKINAAGSAFIYSTYLGGSANDGAYGVAVDAAGNSAVTGATSSPNFPAKNALRATAVGGLDAFVVKLNPSGSAFLYSTYLGGTSDDIGLAVAMDGSGNVYVAGQTSSSDFPVQGAVQTVYGGNLDGFVTGISASGASLLYSTFLGGSSPDGAVGIASDSLGNAVVTGGTSSGNFPAVSALQPYLAGGQDAFVARLFQNGPILTFSPSSLGFPDQPLGTTSSSLPIMVSNIGNLPAILSSISASGNFSQSSNCGSTLAPGSSCSVSVTFSPPLAGLRKGAVTVGTNTAAGLYVVPLSGTGITPIPVVLTSLSPVSVAPGGAGFILQIRGSGFQPGAVVNWNGSPRTTTFVSATQLSALISAADIAEAGTAIITVTNPIQLGPTLANTRIFLTGTGRGVTASDWSQPDIILYNREDASKCNQIHSIHRDGTGDLCLTCGSNGFGGGIAFHNGKLSPNGQWMVMQVTTAASGCTTVDGDPGSGNNQEIWVASYPNINLSQARVSPACIPQRCGNLLPIWHPQGTRIAYGNRQTLCINPGPPDCSMKMAITDISFPGGSPTLGLTGFADVNAANPGIAEPWTWKPDGSVIYYTGHDAGHPYPALAVNSLRLADNAVTVLAGSNGGTWNEFPTIARNGSGIFFSSTLGQSQECTLPGCPIPLFPLDDLYFMSPDGSRLSGPLTGLNIPGSPDYRGGNPAAANGITLNPAGTQGLIDEEAPGTAKWIMMTDLVGPPNVTSNPVTISVASPSPSLFNKVDLPAGNVPGAVATGDLNGDGKADMVMVSTAANVVSIMLGNGDGTFGPRVDIPTAPNPFAVALGDFNGDGILDLATANNGPLGVSVLLGRADGSYQPHADYAAGANPVAIAAGDFNLDGKIDLVTANIGGGTISVLLGNGDGTFKPAVAYAAGVNPAAVILGDFNGDSRLDLAVVNEKPTGSSAVSIMLGLGDGTFPARVEYATGINSWSGAAADLNADGKLDLIVVNANASQRPNADNVSVLLGNGDGTFRGRVDYATGTNPFSVAAADFDRDGKLDLAIANKGGSTVSLLIGNGDGTFQAKTDFPGGQGPRSLASSDFDGDGRADIAVASGSAPVASILFQNTALVSPKIVTFSDQTTGGSSPPSHVTLTNISPATLTLTGITTSSDFTQTNTCGGALAAGASCGIDAVFTPVVAGIRSGTLTITDNSSYSPHVVKLKGNAKAPTFTITLSPNNVIGGVATMGNTVNLASPASPPGLTCTLGTSNASVAAPPQSVTIPSGNTTSPAFSITTFPVVLPSVVNISATCGGGFQSVPLLVLAAGLNTLALSPTATYGGLTTSSNTVALTGLAPANGAVVSLSSSNPQVASVPASITVPGGAAISPAFSIATQAVSSPTFVTISATYGFVTINANLQVFPAALYAIGLAPASIGGGLPTKSNNVSLIGNAPAGGAMVALSSSNPSVASVPPSVVITAGAAISPSFTINTASVSAPTPVTITASYGGVNRPAVLTVNPPTLYAIGLASPSVSGGSVLAGNLVGLSAVAPAGGIVVQLGSSNPAVAATPAAVFVPAGSVYSLPFSITTQHVGTPTPVNITATWGGAMVSVQLTVTP